MDKGEIINIVKEYVDNISTIIKPEKVYLYGSHSVGNANKDSDIDVAFVCNDFKGDYMKTLGDLYFKTIDIDTRIEPVIVSRRNDPSGFIQDIEKTGIEIS
jgi:predicted nucleotidyltransferase